MNWFEETFMFNVENDFKPIFWKQMRYKTFLVLKKGDLETNWNWEVMSLTDLLETKLFWKKKWILSWKKENGVLPFLDLYITWENDSDVIKVFTDETHKQWYVHLEIKPISCCKLGVLERTYAQGAPLMSFKKRGLTWWVETFA